MGVDFKINFLIFESSDAGNFIQRLGRLGRHDGYPKAGKTILFKHFQAYALVPSFFVERLFAGEKPPMAINQTCDRISFHDIIREQYRRINNFDGYYQRWGVIQSIDLASNLHKNTVKSVYAESVKKFQYDCETVFETQFGKAAKRMAAMAAQWKNLYGQKSGNPIVEEAKSFRGSSPLQCGLYDLTESLEGDRFKTYELPGILGNLEIEMLTKGEFLDQLDAVSKCIEQPIAKSRFKDCLGFMKLRRYREERLNWKFTYSGDLESIASEWRVQVLHGLQVWQPDNGWITSINRRLKQQALVCYVLQKNTREVRQRLQLPMHFQIYPISDSNSIHDSTAPYSIAFGQSALLLDTLAYRFKGDGSESWIV